MPIFDLKCEKCDISIEVRDFSVYNILSPNVGNTATTDENGLLFVPESGGGGVTNHSELAFDDGTNPHGTTKSDVGLSNVDNTSDVDKPISTATQQALDLKVDKIAGKQLSTEDYTTNEKNKLAGIQSGAEAVVS